MKQRELSPGVQSPLKVRRPRGTKWGLTQTLLPARKVLQEKPTFPNTGKEKWLRSKQFLFTLGFSLDQELILSAVRARDIGRGHWTWSVSCPKFAVLTRNHILASYWELNLPTTWYGTRHLQNTWYPWKWGRGRSLGKTDIWVFSF